jgi:hypothetical protein
MTTGASTYAHAAASAATTKKGCGCGGSGGHSSPCKCGGGGGCAGDCGSSECRCGSCERCLSEGFSRPRFFAGQLLTEEDLEMLTSYTVGKNRLHNRHLFGDGVVCGLLVRCHPCLDGRVVVEPGYALDCCGNDIVVPCPVPLDINAMAREMRRCGEDTDCRDPRKKEKPASTRGRPTTSGDEQPDTTRYYCLYVKYCEDFGEPTAPYATDEPCGAQSCEWTRVREGFRFELRCQECPADDKTIFDRIVECFPDFFGEKVATQIGRTLAYLGRSFLKSSMAASTVGAAEFSLVQIGEMKRTTMLLREESAKAQKEGANVSGARIWSVADAARETAGFVARFDSLDRGRRQELRRQHADLDPALTEARNALAAAPAVIPEEAYASRLDTELDRAIVRDSLDFGAKLADPGFVEADAGRTIHKAMASQGIVITGSVQRTWLDRLHAWRAQLLEKLEKNTTSDCGLRPLVESIVLPPRNGSQPVSPEETAAFQRATERMLEALERSVLDCLCSLYNPPCHPCDDAGVLLACLTVKDCVVQEICNMKRQFVLTWLSLRHWLPLSELGRRLERSCCPDDICKPEQDDTFTTSSAGATRGTSIATITKPQTGTTTLRPAEAPFTSLNSLLTTFESITPTRTVRPEIGQVVAALADVERIRLTPLTATALPVYEPEPPGRPQMLDPAALRRETARAVDDRLGKPTTVDATAFGRGIIERVERDRDETRHELTERLDKGITEAFGGRDTRAILRELEDVKKLRKDLASLQKKSDALEAETARLQERIKKLGG